MLSHLVSAHVPCRQGLLMTQLDEITTRLCTLAAIEFVTIPSLPFYHTD